MHLSLHPKHVKTEFGTTPSRCKFNANRNYVILSRFFFLQLFHSSLTIQDLHSHTQEKQSPQESGDSEAKHERMLTLCLVHIFNRNKKEERRKMKQKKKKEKGKHIYIHIYTYTKKKRKKDKNIC